MKKYLLEIIVFVCGAVVMCLELLGSRVMAPYLGTSLFVWSSLIGVILGAMSLGYYLGGKLADREPNFRHFSLIILIAAIFVGVTGGLKDIILSFIQSIFTDIRISSILATSLLFAPAGFLLGIVSPYAVRLKIKSIDDSGATVGNLYATSTLGSIIGTLVTGFYLVEHIGTTNLIYFLSITLVVVAITADFIHDKTIKLALFFGLIIILLCNQKPDLDNNKKIIADINTAYQRIIVFEGIDQATNEPIRYLKTDNRSTQSAIFLNNDNLVFDYTKFYHLARHFKTDIKTALMIGGAAYTYPRDFLINYPSSTIDVVEIDPGITAVAKQYFRLVDDPRLNIIHEDGRIFLNHNTKKYDVIFGDAFKSFNPPYQLTTQESITKMFDALTDDGIVMVNIISSLEGPKSKFLRAQFQTFQSIFPEVYVFQVRTNVDINQGQNLMLLAMKTRPESWESDNPELADYLSHLWTKKIGNDLPILTDDFAPVDNYMLNAL